MTVPTPETHAFFMIFPSYLDYVDIINKVFVTAYAVFLHYIDTCLFYLDYLWFGSCSKYSGMPQAILCFEKVCSEDIVMGYMAIIAGGFFSMAAMHPSGILWIHDMTVDASLRIIGQIRMSS